MPRVDSLTVGVTLHLMTKRTEDLLGVDGDAAALRIMLSDMSPAEKKAELARLAKQYADAVARRGAKS